MIAAAVAEVIAQIAAAGITALPVARTGHPGQCYAVVAPPSVTFIGTSCGMAPDTMDVQVLVVAGGASEPQVRAMMDTADAVFAAITDPWTVTAMAPDNIDGTPAYRLDLEA